MEDRSKRQYDTERGTQKIRDGKKECSKCHKIKDISEFWKDNARGSGYSSQCKECKDEAQKRWRNSPEGRASRTKARKLESWRRKGISITVKEYNELLLSQNGRCAICGIHQSELDLARAVDHNHSTGQVRGLLCNKCNFVVAAIESNGDKIEKAKLYIKHWEERTYGG